MKRKIGLIVLSLSLLLAAMFVSVFPNINSPPAGQEATSTITTDVIAATTNDASLDNYATLSDKIISAVAFDVASIGYGNPVAVKEEQSGSAMTMHGFINDRFAGAMPVSVRFLGIGIGLGLTALFVFRRHGRHAVTFLGAGRRSNLTFA